ncbi:MAG: hypothetical protein RIB98_14985 [Acidimicrobiales bacterium]
MDDDEHPPDINPTMSFSLFDTEHDGCGMQLCFLDPDAMEPLAEIRFDDPAALAATLEATMSALKILLTARQHGFHAAIEAHGLAAAIEIPDLTGVELTVEDILEARPGET